VFFCLQKNVSKDAGEAKILIKNFLCCTLRYILLRLHFVKHSGRAEEKDWIKKLMQKLFTSLICSILFTTTIIGMEKERSAPAHFSDDCKKKILIDHLVKDVHHQIKNFHKDSGSCFSFNVDQVCREVGRLIVRISRINWDYYKALEKERNDPVTTRTMLKNIVATYYPNNEGTELEMVHCFKSPGAKKCIELSNQLFNKQVTPKKVKQLYKKGALLNYYDKYGYGDASKETVLHYWVDCGVQGSEAVVKKLLQLGVNPSSYAGKCSPLLRAMWSNNTENITLLLSYKAEKEWHSVVSCIVYHKFIDTIVPYCTQDELNDGLVICASDRIYRPAIMQKLIDNGAKPNVALPHVLKNIIEKVDILASDNSAVLNFNFLCSQGAYDQTVFDKVQNLQLIFGDLTHKLEKNKVLES
jgi:hypothetical protein